jgi:hypothetical protein
VFIFINLLYNNIQIFFKNLFILDNASLSVTHDLMECSCKGCGDIPYKINENLSLENSRDCQFNLIKKQPQQQITINQLYGWQHYKQPISFDLMKVKIVFYYLLLLFFFGYI